MLSLAFRLFYMFRLGSLEDRREDWKRSNHRRMNWS